MVSTISKKVGKNKYDVRYTQQDAEWALKLYIDLLYKYKVDSFMIKHDSEAFALGQTAMFEMEESVAGYLKKNAPNLEYGIAHLPKNKERGTWVKTRSRLSTK